ncbi:MAG: hypothetical protein PHN69_04725 [Candidatus Pacebacteria bacterium]|nr:hypothetical protein [Candidatus Paceibacterota bacterium]
MSLDLLFEKHFQKLKLGQKVSVEDRGKSFYGKIIYIGKKYITVASQRYRTTILLNDIACNNSRII